MNVFAVGFYGFNAEADDLTAIVCDANVELAAQLAEVELEGVIYSDYFEFASVVLLLGESQEINHRCMLVGPLYGKIFNREGCQMWVRERREDIWTLLNDATNGQVVPPLPD